ncbi:MAG TPA: ribulose-phosphate 3-epimerase [Verrucomicrobiota bacterium]|nr:ribulose-phosphate 3-epimerase [Verrucomicrobiota bacterium]HNT15759.1 ribulose-phosphate 3-epimerase [Verrucomicrobiota bacterium]
MIIAPSLLAADFGHFAKETARVQKTDAEWLHLDIMDGHFVPNLSFGPQVVKAVRSLSRQFFDVHLMCSQPEILLEPFVRAGADQLIVHVELGEAVLPLLWKIRSLGRRVGLAINPPTEIRRVAPYLDKIDHLLVMTVNPGFGGQDFIHEALPKVQQARDWRGEKGLAFSIGVDGGVGFDTVGECAQAGADVFVSGSALFAAPSLKRAVTRMRRLAHEHDPALADLKISTPAS